MKPSVKNGMIFQTINSGKLEVLHYKNSREVKIRFIETGYETVCKSSQLLSGQVKDKLKTSVFGVGFVGDGIYTPSVNSKDTIAYSRWVQMLRRCYDDDHHEKHPTYRDCEVCEEWQNFQAFAEWFYENYSEGLHLDKDILIDGNRVYSPDACKFVSMEENTIKAKAKSYMLKSPEGDNVLIYNMAKFCRDNRFSTSKMHDLIKGRRGEYHGWKLCDNAPQ